MIGYYIVDVTILSTVLAVFEISIERGRGWGSGWDKSKWYAKPFAPGTKFANFLSRTNGVAPYLNYHVVFFGIIIPLIVVLEALILPVNAFFYIAVYIGVATLEDLLWFVLDWHGRNFGEMLQGPKGPVFWYKKWVRLGEDRYIPLSYISGALLALLFLAAGILLV